MTSKSPTLVCVAATCLLVATTASAGTRAYASPKLSFTLDDLQCDDHVFGTSCVDTANPLVDPDFFKDDYTHYSIDSAYGYDVMDFDPTVAKDPRPRDGVYAEGHIAEITDESGNVIGVDAKNDKTPGYLTGMLNGEVVAGLGGLTVKAGTEHYVVMDHVCNAPWMPPLVEVLKDPDTGEFLNLGDYTTRMKDDGKILYQWGNYKKRPTQIRLYKRIPLPTEWKEAGADYQVTSAKLTITHRVTTSPNDQIRPEDFENEWASGIKPSYVVDADGRWLSAVDATEGDDDFIPAGTVLRDPALADITGRSIDQWYGYTNAWYTSLDRDPFGGDNPRYRLKSSKFGQDIPGVEIPWYTKGALTTTTIDLLAWGFRDPVTKEVDPTAPSPLAMSSGWFDYNDLDPFDPADTVKDGLSFEGCPLTDDFDLMVYIKGEYSGTEILDAQLFVEWEDPSVPDTDPPPGDVEPDTITITEAVYVSRRAVLKVEATSDAGEIADLSVVYGDVTREMAYDDGEFEARIRGVSYLETVTVVSALGGSATATVTVRSGRD
jgi:hypothetical protein